MTSHIYRLLLLVLPGWFRDEFGREMLHTYQASRGSLVSNARDLIALGLRLHVEALHQDVGYAIRTLRQRPTFTVATIATLAVGLGPTLVVANFLYQIVLSPLPFHDSDALVRMWHARLERNQTRVPLSIPDFIDFRAKQTVFEAFAAHAGTSVAMVIGGAPRQSPGLLTTSDLHEVLGVHPVLGRGLQREDEVPGAPPVLLLGQKLWRSEFGGRADVIGMRVRVDGADTTIVGVLPDTIDFPAGSANFWQPLTLDPANLTRGTQFLNGTARLKRGVSMQQAQDALNSLALGLAAAYPDTNKGKSVELFSLKDQFNGDAPRLVGILTGAIVAVLLIACMNVASLLTVRASTRGSELAVRTALGATGRRLRRQLMVEHLMLAVGGGAVALPLGFALHRAIVERRVLNLPRTATAFGWEAVAVLFAIVGLIGIGLAWIAIRRGAAASASTSLLGSARQTAGRGLLRLRQGLVIAEVAATLILLVTAGLMAESARKLSSVDPGFRTEQVLTFGVVLPGHAYMEPQSRLAFATRVTDGLKQLPGVRSAAHGGYAPMGDMRATRRFARENRPLPETGQEPVALDLPVGADYFSVMGIELKQGRTFTEADTRESTPVMIISETFARTYFPGEDPIGQPIRFYSSRPGGTPPPTRQVVGVVRDVRQDGVRATPTPQMYSPYAQNSWAFLSFFVLTEGDPNALAASVQRVVTAVDPDRPARDVLTTQAIVRGSTERHRAITWMLLALAGLAIVLATVGLYGIVATAAAARSREIAIRAAIGARPGELLRLVLSQALTATAAG
ncbi:MAG TPA: ABC transporter permease, partial [Vicinamibacterales bacterium]|nr:ABC transporter permease [Vicinamibacterales bacterium]